VAEKRGAWEKKEKGIGKGKSSRIFKTEKRGAGLLIFETVSDLEEKGPGKSKGRGGDHPTGLGKESCEKCDAQQKKKPRLDLLLNEKGEVSPEHVNEWCVFVGGADGLRKRSEKSHRVPFEKGHSRT